MSDTMSNPTEWMQFYNPNYSPQPQPPPQPAAGTSSSSAAAAAGGSSSPPEAAQPEAGRVARPARRRTRASRRTPTTLLNTDTSNFRAMVQQFTGGPSGPHGGSVPGFSLAGPTAGPLGLARPAAGYQGSYYHQHQHQHQQQGGYSPYVFGGAAAAAGGEGLFQRLSAGRGVGGAAPEGFFMGVGLPGGGAGPERPAQDPSEDHHRSNNSFMFR